MRNSNHSRLMLAPFILAVVAIFAYRIASNYSNDLDQSAHIASLTNTSINFKSNTTKPKASRSNILMKKPRFKKLDIAKAQKKVQKDNSKEQKLYCILMSLNLGIPLVRDIKISGRLTEIKNQMPDNRISTFEAWVYSSDCPIDTYSIVQGSRMESETPNVAEKWHVDKVLDCRDVSLGDLVVNSGEQGNIKKAQHNYRNEYNFAISGEGSFLLRCSDGGTFLTRKGDFLVSELGFLVSKSGCYVLNPYQRPIFVGASKRSKFSSKTNCFSSTWQCLAVAKSDESGIKGYEYSDRTHLRVELDPYSYIGLNSDTEILEDSLEELDSEDQGPTGIRSWEKIKELTKPESC